MSKLDAVLFLHLSLLFPATTGFSISHGCLPLVVDGFSPFQRHAGTRNRCRKVFTRIFNSVKSTEQDHYKVLGVSPKANQKEIRAAFIKGAKRFHPDVTQDQASLEK